MVTPCLNWLLMFDDMIRIPCDGEFAAKSALTRSSTTLSALQHPAGAVHGREVIESGLVLEAG